MKSPQKLMYPKTSLISNVRYKGVTWGDRVKNAEHRAHAGGTFHLLRPACAQGCTELCTVVFLIAQVFIFAQFEV
jgi:hypothetical protein